jgi:hypothetical protein
MITHLEDILDLWLQCGFALQLQPALRWLFYNTSVSLLLHIVRACPRLPARQFSGNVKPIPIVQEKAEGTSSRGH